MAVVLKEDSECRSAKALLVYHDDDYLRERPSGVHLYGIRLKSQDVCFWGKILPITDETILSVLQDAVGGRYERVEIKDRSLCSLGWTSMYVNEEGLIKGLPNNTDAAKLATVGSLVGRCVLYKD